MLRVKSSSSRYALISAACASSSRAVLDGYPVDRLMHDVALALMAVQTQTTEILSEFPTKAAKEPASPQTAAEAEEIPLF